MADRKTSEHFHNLKEGSDPKRPMVIQSASRHLHDALPDGSNGVKDMDKHRHKDPSAKKSHYSKTQPKTQESGPESQIYAFHESSPFESTKVAKSTSSFESAHHKKRTKTAVPKLKQESMEQGVHHPPKSQASHSTLEALMARGPMSQDRLMSDRGSPVGSFMPPQTKSASLSRDISPSRITAQVVSVLSESYNPPLLHSALTGKLTQSPASSPSPPNRTIPRTAAPMRESGNFERLSSQTIRHLQETNAQSQRWVQQPRLPLGLQAAKGGPEGSRGVSTVKSVSPKSHVFAADGERGVPSLTSMLPRSSHISQLERKVIKEETGQIRGSVSEALSVGMISHSSAPHQSEVNLPSYTSTVLNNVPTTVVYSHPMVRGPPMSSMGPVSVAGSIPSVRAAPPGVRIVGPGDAPLPQHVQKVIVSTMADSSGVTPRELAERLEAELRSHHAAQKRTPSPGPQSRLPKEHASSLSYARHPSSSPQTIHRTPSPSHAGHRTQTHSSTPQTHHRTHSPSHIGHRPHGHISPISQGQLTHGKVSPVPSRPHGRASPSSVVIHHVSVSPSQGKASPVPGHSESLHRGYGISSISPGQGKISPVPSHPQGHISPSPVYRGHGHVSPVQDHMRISSSPPPAHKHPELPPTCRSGQPAVDLTKTHHKYHNEHMSSHSHMHRDLPTIISSASSHSFSQGPASGNMPFSVAQGQVRVSSQHHQFQSTDKRQKEDKRVEVRQEFRPVSQPPQFQGQQYSAAGSQKFLPQPVPTHSNQPKPPVPPHVNPFTFPSKVTSSHATIPIPSYTISSQSREGSVDQPKQKTPLTAPFFPRSASDMTDMRHMTADEKENHSEMPRLVPELPLIKKEEDESGQRMYAGFNHVSQVSHEGNDALSIKPFNMRLQNLANFPVSNTTYRSAYRAQSVAVQRAKACSITSAARSLDILRQNLQRNINKEIDQIVQSYIEKFFKPAISNIQLNNGQNAVGDEHVHAVCRQMLEEAKKMYVNETPRRSVTPVRDETDNVSETGSNSGRRLLAQGRRRRPSDSNSEAGSDISIPKIKKRKGRPPLHQSGRGTPLRAIKPNEPVRREGAKWDPARLTIETKFVMGARANKALGLGATRGRLYIKHPDIFKYSGDQDDKAWLYEHHLMPATGGKAYMLLVEDIQDLSQTDEYRDSPNLLMDELYGFVVPDWILKKMKIQMNAMRTDLGRAKFQRSRSGTPTDMLPSYREMDDDPPKTLPFSNFSDNPSTYPMSKSDTQVSPSGGDGGDEMEFLSAADNDDSAAPDLSPFNVTGGFDDTNSPSPPEVDNLDDPTFVLK